MYVYSIRRFYQKILFEHLSEVNEYEDLLMMHESALQGLTENRTLITRIAAKEKRKEFKRQKDRGAQQLKNKAEEK